LTSLYGIKKQKFYLPNWLVYGIEIPTVSTTKLKISIYGFLHCLYSSPIFYIFLRPVKFFCRFVLVHETKGFKVKTIRKPLKAKILRLRMNNIQCSLPLKRPTLKVIIKKSLNQTFTSKRVCKETVIYRSVRVTFAYDVGYFFKCLKDTS
jgi:hypothetical protein